MQGVVIWDSEYSVRSRMLFRCFCSLMFISPVQSRQAPLNTNFQLTLTWVSTKIPCVREPEKHPPAYSILPRHNTVLPHLHLIICFSRGPLWGHGTLCLWGNSMAFSCFLYTATGCQSIMDFWLLSQLPLQVCLRGNLPPPVALPLLAAASGGREACQFQKLLEGLEHLNVCHPQISAEGNLSQAVLRGRSSTGKEVCVWRGRAQ